MIYKRKEVQGGKIYNNSGTQFSNILYTFGVMPLLV